MKHTQTKLQLVTKCVTALPFGKYFIELTRTNLNIYIPINVNIMYYIFRLRQ